MSLIAHPFRVTNQPGLIKTINAVCSEGRWMSTRYFEPTAAWTHAFKEPACPGHLLLVVGDGRGVVGWCRVFPESCRSAKPVVSLGIGLLPAYRNQGIGTTLVQGSLTWAAGTALRRVTLTTHPDNARAVHVFTRCGFSFTGRAYNGSVEMACELPITFFEAGEIGINSTGGISNHQGENIRECVL